jgi:hypothetical protein
MTEIAKAGIIAHIQQGFEVLRACARFFRRNKSIICLPALAVLFAGVLITTSLIPVYRTVVAYLTPFSVDERAERLAEALRSIPASQIVAAIAIMYVVLTFVGAFLSFALTHQLLERLKGRSGGIVPALLYALRRIGSVIALTFVITVVLMIVESLRALLSSVAERILPSLSWLIDGTFFAAGIALSAGIAFSVPVMVNEGIGLRAATRRTATLIKTSLPHIGVGTLAAGLLFVISVVVVVIVIALIAVAVWMSGHVFAACVLGIAMLAVSIGPAVSMLVALTHLYYTTVYLTRVEGAIPSADALQFAEQMWQVSPARG